MAVLSDYLSGTITVTNGSTVFTGTGTAWRVAGFREGDTVQLQGFTAIIAGTSAADPLIESNTAGHFTEPWAGASGTYAYRMRYLPDGARVTAQTRALIELFGNGVLYSIAELPVEEGKVLIGNDAGQYVLIDKSELGVADPNSNLTGLAALENISNLTELAAIAKANDQFLTMGPDSSITLKPIKHVTDAIAANTAELGTKSAYNWIINGDFTVNQSGGIKKPANGVYGFDGWKGHASGLEQIVEALPAGTYTLTWAGGGVGTFEGVTSASPIVATTTITGNKSIIVPASAQRVSLVSGDASETDPWAARSFEYELARAKRYYEQSYSYGTIPGTNTREGVVSMNGLGRSDWHGIYVRYSVEKRIPPTIVVFNPSNGATNKMLRGGTEVDAILFDVGTTGFKGGNSNSSISEDSSSFHFIADARL